MSNLTPTATALTLSPEDGLSRYLAEIRKFPMLSKDEEFTLAKQWQQDGDLQAAQKLVTSHLRLSAKVAMGYRGYGLPMGEVISEGNIGLMQAVKKFDPDKGFRLATYAMWWIKASIQEYVLRSWSLVKIGTTAAQKKLFFNLRRLKGKIQALEEGDLSPEHVKKIAQKLDVSEHEVVDMNRRMSGGGDSSLNASLKSDGDGAAEWQDWLTDDSPTIEHQLAEDQEYDARREMLMSALGELNEREQRIITARRLEEPALTLEDLAQEFNVSRERIRQIEARALEKLEEAVRVQAAEARV